jgi:HTH-type transcriptional repressor of NAD biosynthesis genes
LVELVEIVSASTREKVKKALVFGKFLPFHKGHQAMIEFAAGGSERVLVCVCASQMETLPGKVRVGWMEETFRGRKEIELRLLEYNEVDLPNTSVSSRAVSEGWANKFKLLFPDVDHVVTSEPYGEFVAEFMGIPHRAFNPSRSLVPVSATQIRADVGTHWDFLPDAVKRSYQQKVVLLGTESTGKSTLAKELAKQFGGVAVEEAGRDIIPDSRKFSIEDLHVVVEAQTNRVEAAMNLLRPLVFLDTDLHITQSYAQFAFGTWMDLAKRHYEVQRADLYLYSSADAPFVQDGTRMPAEQRMALDKRHWMTMLEFGLKLEIISGNWNERRTMASEWVRKLKPKI